MPRLPKMPTLTGPWLSIAAWFFLALSSIQVGAVIPQLLSEPGSVVSLYGEPGSAAAALSYAGPLGILIAMAQLALLATAVVFTLRRSRRARRIGHTLLFGWASWWLLSLGMRMFTEPGLASIAPTLMMTLFFIATVHRSWRGWSHSPSSAGQAEPSVQDDWLHAPLDEQHETATADPHVDAPASRWQRIRQYVTARLPGWRRIAADRIRSFPAQSKRLIAGGRRKLGRAMADAGRRIEPTPNDPRTSTPA